MLKIRENTAHVHNYACTSIHMKKILELILQVHKDGFKERIGGTGNKSETPSA